MSGVRREVLVLAVVGVLLVATIVAEVAIADARRHYDAAAKVADAPAACVPGGDPFADQPACPTVVTTTRAS